MSSQATTTNATIDDLAPSASARWMGERFARMIDPGGTTIERAAVWLFHQLEQGHTCLDFDLAVRAERRGGAAGDEREMLRATLPTAWIADLANHPRVAQEIAGSRTDAGATANALFVLDGRKLFSAGCRHDEIQVANALRAMATNKSGWYDAKIDAHPVDAASPAERAVALARCSQLVIVTGGPGTGKTTIAARMADAILRVASVPLALLAPTGKAAKRLESAMHSAARGAVLDQPTRDVLARSAASTIHAALSARGEGALAHKRLVIVDESSMIHLALMRELLSKLHKDATLILLGDAHQLASIEAGSVFADILPREGDHAHPLAPCTVRLVENYRFPATGAVAQLAGAVNDGAWDRVQELLSSTPSSTVRWQVVRDAREIVAKCSEAFSVAPESRVLCGHRRGPDGALAINRLLAKRMADPGNPDAQDGDNFDGRPIIITVNDPVTGLRNGDTGVIRRNASCESGAGELVAQIEGHDDPFAVAQLPSHEAAYALTIHKSQGSEYERVIVVLPALASAVVTRELLYTAITRTQGEVLIIATESSLRAAVEQRVHRASGLRDRILG